ncbi:GNAT family N-acetyltransferase [Litorihabitans aurantiacus]|uniref:N-acetyltransferase domain-containing protein n=1 Tax=Litorihabitans aurantiacus TaxID=1930061 RepID=A0AA37UH39_9MICO|nr:GNAT family N-acetyltransferase [Litorihabitans aurantiacus]GMA30513.1 hypothetical protein GCM10025875_05050 [Litorihabitans aurantiacus]
MEMRTDPGQVHIGVREVTPADGEFLVDMLLESANWDAETVTRRAVLTTPRLARYANGWGRQGDLGLIAIDQGGPSGLQIPVGAAWIRYFPSTEPGYGFVEPGVPELAMAIIPGRRRLGIGRALLAALLNRARELGVRRLSLSVAPGNPARHLYEQAGFAVVPGAGADDDTSLTMLVDLAAVGGSQDGADAGATPSTSAPSSTAPTASATSGSATDPA